MTYTLAELKKKTVADLREIAKGIEHEAVKGYSQLNKEHLLVALCNALNIDIHEHGVVQGIDKTSIKQKIRQAKKDRDEAIASKDHKKLSIIRRTIHRLKRELHGAMKRV
jgi:hypothetical protein